MIILLDYFQSAERDSDITMVHVFYNATSYLQNDFIGPVTTYDFHFLSGAPLPRNNLLTLFRPFDPNVWGFLLASVVAVSISLIFINKMHNAMSNEPVKETPLQSKNKLDNMVGLNNIKLSF